MKDANVRIITTYQISVLAEEILSNIKVLKLVYGLQRKVKARPMI